jgi:hypothetical protein
VSNGFLTLRLLNALIVLLHLAFLFAATIAGLVTNSTQSQTKTLPSLFFFPLSLFMCLRRHCGKIFCHKCSSFTAILDNSTHRVCQNCHDHILRPAHAVSTNPEPEVRAARVYPELVSVEDLAASTEQLAQATLAASTSKEGVNAKTTHSSESKTTLSTALTIDVSVETTPESNASESKALESNATEQATTQEIIADESTLAPLVVVVEASTPLKTPAPSLVQQSEESTAVDPVVVFDSSLEVPPTGPVHKDSIGSAISTDGEDAEGDALSETQTDSANPKKRRNRKKTKRNVA